MQSKPYPANGNSKSNRAGGQKDQGSLQSSMNETTPISKKIAFEDNRLLSTVFGQHDCHLAHLEEKLGIVLINRGNQVTLNGSQAGCTLAEKALRDLYQMAKQGHALDIADVDGVVRMISGDRNSPEQKVIQGRGSKRIKEDDQGSLKINTRNRVIQPRTPAQAYYIRSMLKEDMVFGVGPAGTGKTYLAVALAVSNMIAGNVDRIILSRPAVEAGESLGFLPGDLKDKIDPYLRPLYDALYDMLPAEQVAKKMASGEIEIAPLAYMRGRTLSNSFVILDEAQNTTSMQMKMILTRFGENSRMVICGDPSQVDLPGGCRSGLGQALDLLKETKGIAVTRFTSKDVVRHPLVARIVDAYDNDPRRDD
ncbi:PhoH family protein [Temperatibacter marinus]|uniref:PhoH-like protein n=1 Tax=Temperatibacter marinus TaxID=1456591 RepID=A0AA52EG77_9PROT|nr:PhoH family protein [Temperatibacter marinus]WND04155.1 PhoH family protein [Temperatibacter marinus]